MLLQLAVQVHDIQDIHQLSLVLMKPLDLHIKNGSRIDIDAVVFLDVLCQTNLVLVLDVHELLLRLLIVSVELHLRNLRKIRDPLVPDMIRHPVREKLITVQKEPALRDSIRLVVELLRHHFVEILQRLLLQDLRVQLCDAIDRVARNNRQVRHPHLSIVDDSHLCDLVLVARVPLLHLRDEAAVDLLDDLINTWKESREQLDWPLLKRLRHDGVVCVGDCLRGDLPRLIPAQAFLIEKNAHQLGDSDRWMRIVHLEGCLLIELVDVAVLSLVLRNRLLDGRGDKEILLLEPQLLTGIVVVVRVKNLDDVARQILLLNRLLVVTLVK